MKFKLIYLLFLLSIGLQAQILEPVQWAFSHRIISETEAELVFEATLQDSWHVYGMQLPEDGPIPTTFTFERTENAVLSGEITSASKLIKEYDPNFDMELSWYEKKAVFIQKIKRQASTPANVSGFVRFMCCNDSSCLPPKKVPFSFIIKEGNIVVADDTLAVGASPTPAAIEKVTTEKDYWLPVTDQLKSFGEKGESTGSDRSLWFIFLAGFVGGLLALFTPCVWPIIPMTVSFFLKRNKNPQKGRREAIFYGLSIIFIYLALGILITLIFGASALNTLSTNAIFNLVFFAILIVFAISFFGFFDITLPASWSTALNNKAEHTTGLFSIFLMAFTLAVVSFSCTGPIIGTLLVEVSSTGSLLSPAVGMFGFALALALPFSIFALFPSWLNSMPRSGSWMNMIKVSLAFLELALALKFLSVADLTSGWGILPRNLFIALWIVIFLGWALYMLGIIRFPHDSKGQSISTLRKISAGLILLFVIYLARGFWGAPLKDISAFLPPQETSEVFHDYDEGMQYADKHGLPVFLDFTGYGCVNCRKMEAAVFTHDEVKNLLSQFVIISLYVDERKELEKPITVSENNKTLLLETQGERWSYLQRIKFGANAQPYYIALDNDGNPISQPYAYNEDIEKFTAFLKNALERYKHE
jgi:thiol:disulfide interchange protein DsbD